MGEKNHENSPSRGLEICKMESTNGLWDGTASGKNPPPDTSLTLATSQRTAMLLPELLEGNIYRSPYMWVCLKIGYIPNYSHLIGIMLINHWV